jgi:hypothetical protein
MRRQRRISVVFQARKTMKKKIDAIIVVEGITDIAFLNSFIDAEFVSTNGSDVPDTTMPTSKNKAILNRLSFSPIPTPRAR